MNQPQPTHAHPPAEPLNWTEHFTDALPDDDDDPSVTAQPPELRPEAQTAFVQDSPPEDAPIQTDLDPEASGPASPQFLIDETIKSALSDHPEAWQRLLNHEKGAQKLHAQVQSAKPALELYQALTDPLTAADTVRVLAQHLLPPPPDQDGSQGAEADGFSREERISIRQFIHEQRQRQADDAYLQTRASHVIQAVKESTGGWVVTPQMVLSARKSNGHLDAVTALKCTFPDEYAEFIASRGTRPGRDHQRQAAPPTLPEPTPVQGRSGLPDMARPGGLIEFFSM